MAAAGAEAGAVTEAGGGKLAEEEPTSPLAATLAAEAMEVANPYPYLTLTPNPSPAGSPLSLSPQPMLTLTSAPNPNPNP